MEKEKIVDTISKDWGSIVVKEIEDKSDKQSTYTANWIYEEIHIYSWKIKFNEMKKIS